MANYTNCREPPDDDGEYPECYEAGMLALGCNFPWIRENMDDEECGQTYAERIAPYHTNWSAIYSIFSGILMVRPVATHMKS